MNKSFKVQAQGGFTLIELIVVIVILGILAATALPKFSDLSGDARAAKAQAAKGSIAAVSAMAHGKFLVTNTGSSITMEGTTVNLTNGYPTADANLAAAAGLAAADYTIAQTGTVMTVTPTGVTTAASCQVTYNNAANSTTPPVISIAVGNCN